MVLELPSHAGTLAKPILHHAQRPQANDDADDAAGDTDPDDLVEEPAESGDEEEREDAGARGHPYSTSGGRDPAASGGVKKS